MKVVLSDRAIESLSEAPPNVQRAFEKQLRFLMGNLLHPFLHAKKYDESKDLWQARVNQNWRFYFTIMLDT
jgi:mRNA-degrading endonuclease RelE of RelBE toxin-antitoxin system